MDPVEKALNTKDINSRINAVVEYNDRALEEAEQARRRGLEPIPLGVKDIIYTERMKTTMGSRLYRDFIAGRDAEVVKRLKNRGFIVIGKTNTHEFASGVTTTSSIHGPTRNPLDPDRIAGGSSGGSAAAVAAGIVPIALGTDTAGSTRIPPSLCGVYGLRPTYGLVSLDGVYPLAPSFDTVGFIARDPDLIEKALKASIDQGKLKMIEAHRGGPKDASRIRFGVPKWFRASEEVEDRFYSYISSLNYVEVDMPVAERIVFRYFPIARLSEATYIHIGNRDRWDLYFPDVRRMLEKGLEYRAYEYLQALAYREEVYSEFRRVIKKVDALITPTTMIEAPKIEDVLGREDGEVRSMLTHNVIYASYIGLPAISIPSLEVGGLPVGVQVMCDRYGDLRLLDMARALRSL